MQALKAMAEVLEQDAQLSDTRSLRPLQAQSALSRGAVLLGVAAADNYRDRALVLEACDLMLDAIQYGRGQIEPYLHLAHVFIVFRDDRQALKYLALARELDPHHPDVALYSSFLSGPHAQETAPAENPVPSETTPWQSDLSDADAAYDELEQTIYTQVRAAMQSELAHLAPSPEVCLTLRQHVQHLGDAYTRIQTRLRQLEGEFDVLELSRKAKPLELLLRRSERVLAQAEEMGDLGTQMDGLEKQAAALLQDVLADERTDTDARLEDLIDACDRVADALDALETAQVPCAELLVRYERVVAKVAQIQDEVE
ncbi:MAG: hypothetical protein ACO1RX_11650 [Candidatus Sericytochromatia bacterium]